jgi:hypothetical protein
MSSGFMTKGAEPWEVRDPGSMEEFKKFGAANPVWLGKSAGEVKGYGKHTVEAWARPRAVRSGSGMTLAGGMYAPNPEDVVPTGLFHDRRK